MPIVYVLPGLFLAGGVRVVLRHANGLVARGHAVEVWALASPPGLPPPPPPGWVDDRVGVRLFPSPTDLLADLRRGRAVKVATWWETAEWVADSLAAGERGYYLVQDIETSYAVTDAGAARILASYQLGLTPLTEGRWVDRQLRDRGLEPRFLGIGLDHDTFRPDATIPRQRSLLAQARRWGGGPRDLKDWPTTLAVLTRVAATDGGIEAVTFSAEPPPQLPGVRHRHHAGPTDVELAELYRRAGVFLFASRHEGFGLPAAEAMACGCPVVATRAHGNEEFCLDNETALMADAGDVETLTRHVRNLLDDPSLAARLAEAGRARVRDYRWEPVIDRLEAALELPRPHAIRVPRLPPTRGVLLACELGSGFGHAAPLLRLAHALAAEGFAPLFAVRDLAEAFPLLGDSGFPLLQAPTHRTTEAIAGMLAGYADVLAANGFGSPQTLAALMAGWDSLFAAIAPVLVVADHSPAAVLAARGAVPVVQVGAGFELPPADDVRFARLLSDGVEVGDEAEMLTTMRTVLAARGKPDITTLTEPFRTARAVTVLPEFDPYAPVRREACVGPLTALPRPLPAAAGTFFAYLSADSIGDDALLDLARVGPGAIYLRGLDGARAGRLLAAGVPLVEAVRPWQDVLAASAVVVHHGGVGTAQSTAAAGRVQVIVPRHQEQLLTGFLVEQLGLGGKLIPPTTGAELAGTVRAALESAAVAATCRAFADRLAGRTDRDGLAAVVEICQAVAGSIVAK